MSFTDDRHETVFVSDMVCVHETPKALLVIDADDVENRRLNRPYKAHWVPKSQIHGGSDITEVGDKGALAIPRWLAEQEDLA